MDRFFLAFRIAFSRSSLMFGACLVMGILFVVDDANAGQRRVESALSTLESLPKLEATKAFAHTSILLATLKNAPLAVVQVHFLAEGLDVNLPTKADQDVFLRGVLKHLESRVSPSVIRKQRFFASLERGKKDQLVVVISVVAAPNQLFSASRTLSRFFSRVPSSKAHREWEKLRRRTPISLVAVSGLSLERSRRTLTRAFAPVLQRKTSTLSASRSLSLPSQYIGRQEHSTSSASVLRRMLHPVGFATVFAMSHHQHASLKEFEKLLRGSPTFDEGGENAPLTTLVSAP